MYKIENKPKLLDSLKFKKYTKTYKGKTYDEVGVVIEDLEKIDGIEDYNLVMTPENPGDEETNGLKYLKYVPFFMVIINELKERIEELERPK